MYSHIARLARLATTLAMLSAVVAFPATPAGAQTKQPTTPMPGSPPPAERMETPAAGSVEGSLKRVDPSAGTVRVAHGPFGLLGRTLGVMPSTRIQVQGRDGSLADLREGAKVKASYEVREGKSVATQIDVLPDDSAARQSK